MRQILDLHIHSKYSRACSPNLELPKIDLACQKKGINICATGDFTHPKWLEHIKETLIPANKGLYHIKGKPSSIGQQKTKFILSTEVSCIYKHKEATRRLHLVILAPNIEAVEKLNNALVEKGVNLRSDGRPIMGLSAKQVLQMLLEIDEHFLMIPAHVWTPWFSIFGSKSGYDSVEDCFEDLSPHICTLETGLSSDPPMNRLWSALDRYTLVSNSDAHSLEKLGREANVFEFENESEITYDNICKIIKQGDRKKFLFTIEFFPEEGKYHFDGHADCKVCFSPKQTKKEKFICPECKRKLTVGVLHRVEDLSDRETKDIIKNKFIPHKYIVPLIEIISFVHGAGVKSKKVMAEYERLVSKFGDEFNILIDEPIENIQQAVVNSDLALAIENMRSGKISLNPGYDGIYGRFDLFPQKNSSSQSRLLI